MTSAPPLTMPVTTGWSATELAALHIAGVPPRRLRTVLAEHPTAAQYRAAHAAGTLADLPPLPDPRALPDVLPPDVWVLWAGDEDYPPQLAAAPSPPLLLYGRGNRAALSAGIAIVGTRQMTDLGRIVAELVAETAASLGASVISGLAVGVDTAAALAALRAGTPTVAVLAAGVLHPTPAENADLALRILDTGGAVISEQTPGYDPADAPRGDRRYAQLLQARNRIIAGLSSVVVPAEGSRRSGTVGTVWAALAAGRPVVVARPRRSHWQAPGAQLPLMLANTRPRSATDLRAAGMPGPLADEWATRVPLASGVAEDREELVTLIGLAYRLSPHRLDPQRPPAT